LSEVVDVRQSETIGNIFEVRRGLADRGDVFGAQSVGDAHFIQISVACERWQAAVLVFPAEAPHACLTWCFQHLNLDGLAVNPAFADVRLVLGKGQQRLIVNRLDKAVSQSIERRAQRPDGFRRG
jgi:hypothetical protein